MKGARHCKHAISQSCCCCCRSWHNWQHPVQPDNTSNLNVWRQDQHLLKRARKRTNTEDSTSIKPQNYWFQCKRFEFPATMLRKTRVFWDMTLCHCEVVPGVSNNRSSFIFSLSSGSSSFDCTTTLLYLKSYVFSDTFYIPEHFHISNVFYSLLSALNVMKHNERHIPLLPPLLCAWKGFEVFATRVMYLKGILISTGVGRETAVGTDTRYGLGGPGIESRRGQDFPQPSRPALGPIQPHVQWVPGLFRG